MGGVVANWEGLSQAGLVVGKPLSFTGRNNQNNKFYLAQQAGPVK
jgi:hypothetical protein